ncbi:MAG: hypothetical protein PVF76_09020 [Syntrophobacterales bacterium]|jgi:hypothetical protein
MKTLVVLVIVLAFCTHCSGGGPPSNTDGVKQNNTEATSSPRNTTAAQGQTEENLTTSEESGALRVYIDPETGEFTSPPARGIPAARTTAPSATSSTSHEGLEERPSPVPGGGTMVDLKGRFHSPLTATIDVNGKTRIEHQVSDEQE